MDSGAQAGSEVHCPFCGGAGPEVDPVWISCKDCVIRAHVGCTGATGDQGWQCSPCREGPDLGALAAQLKTEAPLLKSEGRTFEGHEIFLKVPKVAERGQHELMCYEVLRGCGAQGKVAAKCWGAVDVWGKQILVLEQLDPLTDQEFVQEIPALLTCVKTFHEAGVLAVDIKPEHLMRRRKGTKGVVLVDLDLACFKEKLPPGAAGRPTSPLFKQYIITPNAVSIAIFMGTLRYAPLSAHLGLAPTKVGDFVCLFFSLWHKRAGLPWSRVLDTIVQNCLEKMESRKQKAAEKSEQVLARNPADKDEDKWAAAKKQLDSAVAELEAWQGGLRQRMGGEFLRGLYADFKLGLMGTGVIQVGDKAFKAAEYSVGSLTLEDARISILEAEAAAHEGEEGVQRGVQVMQEVILQLAEMPSSVTKQPSPQKQLSKEGHIVAGGVKIPPDSSEEASGADVSADSGVSQLGGDSEMSSTSRLAQAGGLSTTELENRLQESTAEAEEEMRQTVGSVLGVAIKTRRGKLVHNNGAYSTNPAGTLRASLHLLALRPATLEYEIDGFGKDERTPGALVKTLAAAPADRLELSHMIVHPTSQFPLELRVKCGEHFGGQAKAKGTDILMEVIASSHPRSIAAKYGQIEAGICMLRRHPLSLSLQPALLLVAFVGKLDNMRSSIQNILVRESAEEVLPYLRYASLLGCTGLLHATTPRAAELGKKVKRRQEALRNTSTLASLLGSNSAGRLASGDILEVRLQNADTDPIEVRRPATIAALKQKCCEVFKLSPSQIARLRINSLRDPDTFNQLNEDWQLRRDSTALVEVVLAE